MRIHSERRDDGQAGSRCSACGRNAGCVQRAGERRVVKNNRRWARTEALEKTPYEKNWVCVIDADNLDVELPQLKIGKSAVAFFEDDIDRFRTMARKMTRTTTEGSEEHQGDVMYAGELQDFNDRDYEEIVSAFFER